MGSGRPGGVPHVLTVAGSDSGAGAGIQADLKACGAMGVYCSTVITAVTAQNTVGVQVKTGMLPSVGVIEVLSHKLKEYPVRALVVDPVMVATSGDVLSPPSTLSGYKMNKRWGRSITDAVKLVIEGGATIVQLREKEAETLEFLESAKSCLEICRFKGVPLVINDRVDIALACDADGVHVGQSDMPVRLVRQLLGPNKIIGVSCKTQEQAHRAWLDGADYIGSGGVFPTNTKAGNLTIGLDGLKSVCLSSKLPVVAIGGIKIENARTVMDIGVPNLRGVAVVSALFDHECVPLETKRFRAILTECLPA